MKEEVFLRYSRDSSHTGNWFLIRCRILAVIEEKNTVRLCVCVREGTLWLLDTWTLLRPQSVHLLSVLQLLKLSNINSKKTDLAELYIIVFGKLETVYFLTKHRKNSVCDKTQTLTKRFRTRGDRIKKTATPLELLLE